jgi:hypothetical protein
MTKGNNDIDQLLISLLLLEVNQYHKQTHTNWRHLKQRFNITQRQTKKITSTCHQCQQVHGIPFPPGVNPRGDKTNHI